MSAITYTVVNADKIISRLRSGATSVRQALLQEMEAQMSRAADWSRANKLSGDPLNRRSGRLSRSVTGRATEDGDIIRGSLSSNVSYAAVHELGGTFSIPESQRISALGKPYTVRAHTATYPQRAFLRPALESNRDVILQGLRRAIMRSVS